MARLTYRTEYSPTTRHMTLFKREPGWRGKWRVFGTCANFAGRHAADTWAENLIRDDARSEKIETEWYDSRGYRDISW